jgi:hypothetical protein
MIDWLVSWGAGAGTTISVVGAVAGLRVVGLVGYLMGGSLRRNGSQVDSWRSYPKQCNQELLTRVPNPCWNGSRLSSWP